MVYKWILKSYKHFHSKIVRFADCRKEIVIVCYLWSVVILKSSALFIMNDLMTINDFSLFSFLITVYCD